MRSLIENQKKRTRIRPGWLDSRSTANQGPIGEDDVRCRAEIRPLNWRPIGRRPSDRGEDDVRGTTFQAPDWSAVDRQPIKGENDVRGSGLRWGPNGAPDGDVAFLSMRSHNPRQRNM